jgi:hypothetical protein
LIILVLVLAAAVITGIILWLLRRNRAGAVAAWRRDTAPMLDEAMMARALLPASGEEISDDAHWHGVREQVEQASATLEVAGAKAPDAATTSAMLDTAKALRGSLFALEAHRLLSDGIRPPTAEQLADADAVIRARTSDADAALARLGQLVRPPQPDQTTPATMKP